MKNVILATTLSLFAVGAAQGAIVTITFNDISLIGYDEPNHYSEAGFSFTIVPKLSVSNHLDGNKPVVLHTSSSDAGFMVTYGGKPFSLLSFDYALDELSEANVIGNDGSTVLFAGVDLLWSPLVHANIGLYDVTSAVFRVSGVGGGYLAFDNLVIDTDPSSVPEPAILTLLGLGLAGLARFRRPKS